jgi:SAM-dependent methyltransferase
MDADLFPTMARLEDWHWWFSGRREIAQRMLARIALPPRAEILDAGCGTGGNLAMLSQFGAVSGMEFDSAALELARRRGVGDVRPGCLPDSIPFEKQRFDLITLMDVLEHVEQDVASLTSLRAHLKPGGSLFITVPAFPFMWSHHDVTHHHYRRYRASGLRAAVTSAGYTVAFSSYYNMWLFPFISAARLVQRGIGGKKSDLGPPPRMLNWMLRRIFASERHWLGRGLKCPVGVSLMLIARPAQSVNR